MIECTRVWIQEKLFCRIDLNDNIFAACVGVCATVKKETNMGKSGKLFSTSMFGYSKDEVRSYDKEQKERQERLESQIKLQSDRIRSLEDLLRANENEINVLNARLDEASKQRDAIARVLVDAELRADGILQEAIEKGETETQRLMQRADLVRDHIAGQIDRVRDVEDAAETFARAIIARLRASADLFEQELMGAVGDASADTEKVLADTAAVLDEDYFAPVRQQEKAEEPAEEVAEETAKVEAEAETGETDAENAENEDIPSDYSFSTSEEGQGFFKVVRA